MTKKEFCKKVNQIAKESIERAQGWVACYNRDNGTNYFILNKRIVFKVVTHGVETIHDGLIWAE